ncbi:MAG: RNase adaptor protein RapZ, partial [Sphingomonadales bacterium]|nr:RNase adaptor protein RapZ [Sphingomonadales bacterium]
MSVDPQPDSSSSETPARPDRQRVLLVTGLLGAGKSTVLKVLEDLGWETIDNFPVRLLHQLVSHSGDAHRDNRLPLAIGFDSRTRGFDPHRIIARVKALSEQEGIEVTTLFLDCSGQELERRYNETRRR